MGNAGPGFGLVGSMSNYGMLSDPALLILFVRYAAGAFGNLWVTAAVYG